MALQDLELFSLCYLAVYFCLLFPPPAFKAAGLTVEGILSDRLGSEQHTFIDYHLKRTCANKVVHVLLLALLVGPVSYELHQRHHGWQGTPYHQSAWGLGGGLVVAACVLFALRCCWLARDGFENHPTALGLKSMVREWRLLADAVNTEFASQDVVVAEAGSDKLVVAANWLAYCRTYSLHIAHQRDVDMAIQQAFDVRSQEGVPLQILTIKVTSIHEAIKPFEICLNSAEYEKVQAKLHATIRNTKQIMIMQSVSDRFMSEFTAIVEENTQHYYDSLAPEERSSTRQVADGEVADLCAGCMTEPADVLIRRICRPPSTQMAYAQDSAACTQCLCTRPMWCVGCMGRWFSSRQNQLHPEGWLVGKAPCPTCRATFCVFDVCLER